MSYPRLQKFFTAHPSAALGFSGGVDSSFLLYAGLRCGADIRPYFAKTAFQPAFELADALRICAELNVKLHIIELDILNNATVAQNPPDRCYFCKRQIFEALAERAKADGYHTIIDGNNASDDAADRAGMRAVEEMGVRSPLRECGLAKDTIRQLSREAGLFTWDKPAYACLATRVLGGQPITAEKLHGIEAAEQVLFALGFSDFRVRMAADGSARVQVTEGEMGKVMAARHEILGRLREWFPSVTLDLTAR
jgi:uncharacterized protein